MEYKIEETFKLDHIERVKCIAKKEVIVMMKSTSQDRYFCRRVPPHIYTKFKKELEKGMTEAQLNNFDKKHKCYSHKGDRCVVCLEILITKK